MNEETAVLEHINFNKDINELLAVKVKIDEENKALILFSSLLESYDHIVTTMLVVRKLSTWSRSRQLYYLIRLEKGQIKRRR